MTRHLAAAVLALACGAALAHSPLAGQDAYLDLKTRYCARVGELAQQGYLMKKEGKHVDRSSIYSSPNLLGTRQILLDALNYGEGKATSLADAAKFGIEHCRKNFDDAVD